MRSIRKLWGYRYSLLVTQQITPLSLGNRFSQDKRSPETAFAQVFSGIAVFTPVQLPTADSTK